MPSTSHTLLAAAAVVAVAAVVPAGLVSAQAAAPRNNELAIEATPFRGSIGYGRRTGAHWYGGVSIGFGFPQLDQTPTPAHTDFRDYLHVSPYARWAGSEHVNVELGWRFGVADLRPCDSSDCWPGLYTGPSAAVMVGWRDVKLGSRVTAGWHRGPGASRDRFVGVAPLNVLVTRRW